jgi:hypothetical protein
MKKKPMTPAEFTERMKACAKEEAEVGHVAADELFEELAMGLGYGAGVRIFRRMDKWYA